MTKPSFSKPPAGVLAIGAGVLAVAGAAFLARPRDPDTGNHDDAPGRTARKNKFGDYAVVGKTVTIAKPSRAELYAFWRDFTNLPAFFDNLKSVEMLGGDRSRWTIAAPGAGTVALECEIAREEDGKLIAWRSVEGSDIDTEGRVSFRDAPGNRGTQVELVIAYKPPLGSAGRAIATAFGQDPAIQSRLNLRRFKSLMETGEIATSNNRLQLEEAA